MEQFEIKSDALGIIKRIKAWNKHYRVFYNIKTKKYVLKIKENSLKPCEYSLTFPFNQIDERMLIHIQKSEIQNREKYLQEIENENALLLKKEQKNLLEQMEKNIESKRNN